MIYILLDAYLDATAQIRKKWDVLQFLLLAVFALCFAIGVVMIIKDESMLLLVFELLLLLAVLGFAFLWEHKNRKQANSRFATRNRELDSLKTVIRQMPISHGSWMEKTRLQFLIADCEQEIVTRREKQTRLSDFIKFTIFPIIGFMAGAILDKATLPLCLAIALIAFLGVTLIYLLKSIFDFSVDALLKSTSLREQEHLLSALKELYAREYA